MKDEDYSYNLDEHTQHVEHLSRVRHIEEYSEDIYRQQRKDNLLYSLDYNLLEINESIFQIVCIEICHSQSQGESHYQSCHHVQRFWNVNSKERYNSVCFTDFRKRNISCYEHREEGLTYSI